MYQPRMKYFALISFGEIFSLDYSEEVSDK